MALPMSPADFKGLWLQALRSRGYRQGRGYLMERDSRGPRYCCLGVGVRVLGLLDMETGGCVYDEDAEPEYGQFSPGLQRALGMDETLMQRLINMNDGDRATFAQIADVIDEEYNP